MALPAATGQILRAADLNGLLPVPTTYTITTTGWTVGTGSSVGKYRLIGKMCHVDIRLGVGSTTVVSAGPTFSLPFTAQNSVRQYGKAHFLNAGVKDHPGVARIDPATPTVVKVYHSGTGGTGNIGATTPHTWATSDILRIAIAYEIA